MKKTELLTALRDIREYYREAVAFQIEGKSAAASARLIDADETLLPLIEAVENGRLSFKGSAEPIPGNAVGERLRFVREKNGITHWDVMRILSRPRSNQSWYSRVESGEKAISVADLKTLARFYGVTLDELVP